MDSLLERLFRASIQVWNLQRVLCKKRDPLSYARLVDVVLASPAYAVHTIADTTESSEGTVSSTPIQIALTRLVYCNVAVCRGRGRGG